VTDRVAVIQTASGERSGTITSSGSRTSVIVRFRPLAALLRGGGEPRHGSARLMPRLVQRYARNTDNSITIDGRARRT
jgi:hypothetical protein